MRMRNISINAAPIKAEIRNWYAFDGPLGEVVPNAKYFFAWKDGILIGTYSTLGEATASGKAPTPRPAIRLDDKRMESRRTKKTIPASRS